MNKKAEGKIGKLTFVGGFALILIGGMTKIMWIAYVGVFLLIMGAVIDRVLKI
ncbi:MAG: hypothetical protein KKD17_04600 [Nanoarchaeota archaeon]|nr:hypothetical protein [Nanoarchaeota archaeon]